MGNPRLSLPAALAAALALGAPADGAGGSLDRVPRAKALSAAREVDRLVDADLAAHKIRPNPPADDAAFLRRAYLDLVGRIPTADETAKFLSSSASDKREALVDALLESPGYVSHQFNWLADLLRVKTRLNNNVSGEPYIHFLKQSLADNKPWDAFVRDLLTATGPAHARGSGATGYYLRDRGMPEDNMSNTIRIFLGTRLECAQCHDHPFDDWTQLQYHEMVAFTGGLQYVDRDLPKSPEGERLKAMEEAYREAGNRRDNLELRAFRRIMQPLGYGISGTGTGVYRLPKDYQYDNAKPNDVVQAKAIFGPEVKLAVDAAATKTPEKARAKNARPPALRAKDINSREAYARWLTSPENTRFTAVVVNRLWKRLFGAGIYEPVDNFRSSSKPVNAPLEAFLEKTMVEAGYDLKQFLRILAYSKTYQREATRTEPSDEEPYRFPGPMLRRMSAEQLWDSMVTLAAPDVDSTLRAPGEAAESVYADYERILKISEEEVKQRVAMEVLRTKDPAKYREMQREAAAMARLASRKDDDLRRKVRDLEAKLKAARKKGDEATAKALQAELRGLQPSAMMMPGMMARSYRRGNDRNTLARASELQQPASPGHFLREFGQSDREQIEANHTDASVPQALSLLNGFVDKTLLPSKTSAVRLAAAAAKSPEEKVLAVFRSVLSRDPSAKERDAWTGDVRSRGDAALGDLVWTLVNTHEFMFIR